MIRTFTQDDLIRYAYHETTEEETREIEKAIICDSELESAYKKICGVKKRLDETQISPSERVTQNILNYSKSLNLLSKK